MNKISKRDIFFSFLFSLLASWLIFGQTVAYAADEGTVTTTVTVQNISVSVADGNITYGTLAVSATRDTTNDQEDESQTATNNGNVAEDFNIRGQNSTNWALSTSPGIDQYAHKFCIASCDDTPSWTALTTSNQALGAGSFAATTGNQVFDLQISTPTSTAHYTEQSVDVIVQAVIDS